MAKPLLYNRSMSDTHEIIIGIDLGTTNSLAAYSDAAGPFVLKNVGDGSPTDENGLVPSVVHFASDGSVQVGAEARTHAVEQPLHTVYSIKRLMGIGGQQAANEMKHLAYHVVTPPSSALSPQTSDIVFVEVDGQRYSPQEISAIILRAVKRRAELYFQREVKKAVLTVPAYFNDSQRQATKDAGRIAGLEVVRIVNEPTAAALAYGLGERTPSAKPKLLAGALFAGCPGGKPEHAGKTTLLPIAPNPQPLTPDSQFIAVYDLGGGTFDISILQLHEGVFQVLSTHGDTHLGGDDLDRELIGLFQREIEAQLGRKLDFPPSTRQALRDFAEAAKIRLSTEPSATVEIAIGNQENIKTPKRQNAETQSPVLRPRSFLYRRTITREEFERLIAPWVEKTTAACQIALQDAGRTPADIAEVVLVGGCTRIPLVKRRVEQFFGRVPYDAINPDEVVALGAAVQASILAGIRRDVLLLDVVPLSLGIETMGGAMGKLIVKNTPIPAMATELFSTYLDGQTRVAINVLQGERELAKDCRSLGRFELSGLPPMPAGLPKIEVTFLIDANGILNVSATEQRSGVQASIQVVPAHGLTKDEVDRLEAEAIAKAKDDFTAHRLIDLRLNVTRDLTAAQRDLKHAGGQLTPQERSLIEGFLSKLAALENQNDPDAIQQTLEAFNHHPARIRLAEKAITAALQKG